MTRALALGDFYTSTGVNLENLTYAKKVVGLRIEAKLSVTYTTTFHYTFKESGHDGIGLIVATVTGPNAPNEFRVNELYVRTKVTSTHKHPNPSNA